MRDPHVIARARESANHCHRFIGRKLVPRAFVVKPHDAVGIADPEAALGILIEVNGMRVVIQAEPRDFLVNES